MALDHDPPHIKLYYWPNVPARASELADSHGFDDILGVAVAPDEINFPDDLVGNCDVEWVIDEDGKQYGFIH